MPRAADAVGVRDKLLNYSLDITHASGGPKAYGFERILGITRADIDYLEDAIRTAILTAPIKSVRNNHRYGAGCLVEFPLRGINRKSGRVVDLRTTWELASPSAPPRLATAYLRP